MLSCVLCDTSVSCALSAQDEDSSQEKAEMVEKKDPTHYSKLDTKTLKVCNQCFLCCLQHLAF